MGNSRSSAHPPQPRPPLDDSCDGLLGTADNVIDLCKFLSVENILKLSQLNRKMQLVCQSNAVWLPVCQAIQGSRGFLQHRTAYWNAYRHDLCEWYEQPTSVILSWKGTITLRICVTFPTIAERCLDVDCTDNVRPERASVVWYRGGITILVPPAHGCEIALIIRSNIQQGLCIAGWVSFRDVRYSTNMVLFKNWTDCLSICSHNLNYIGCFDLRYEHRGSVRALQPPMLEQTVMVTGVRCRADAINVVTKSKCPWVVTAYSNISFSVITLHIAHLHAHGHASVHVIPYSDDEDAKIIESLSFKFINDGAGVEVEVILFSHPMLRMKTRIHKFITVPRIHYSEHSVRNVLAENVSNQGASMILYDK